jgi:hypothetical protein
MKIVAIAISLLLVGCASTPETEEMARQALETGDWSEVERIERVADKRRRQVDPVQSCADTHMYFCESLGSLEKCGCVSPAVARAKLSGR